MHKGKLEFPSEADKGVRGVQEGKNGPEGLVQGPGEGIHPVCLATSARLAPFRNRMRIKRREGGVVLVEADLVIIVLEEHQVYDAVRCCTLYKPVFVGGSRLKGEQAEAITQRLLFIALCQQGGGLVVPVIPIECAHFHVRFMFDEVTLRVW
mmetsp:Transcript_4898/g.5586  ORF Transcript_4898/g.5586 Transcript_4898/m.5586 type:complete len:152 (-) Transcript_4898:409-864(-)